MIAKNYLFGPFIGETTYELNYFVGHAIYLRKQNPKNKIIVLTREEHFDLYGKYATTFLKLPLSKDLIPHKFGCDNIMPTLFDETVRKFEIKYRNKKRISKHFYPQPNSNLKDIRWYYHRDQIDFDFKPRDENKMLINDMTINYKKIILSRFDNKIKKYDGFHIFPSYFLFELDLNNSKDITALGLIIEMIRKSEYVYADIDDIVGRLAMLMRKPLITKRDVLDVKYLSPINPYESIVIGCTNLEDGIKHLETLNENNI